MSASGIVEGSAHKKKNKSFFENKTQKTLTRKNVFGITLPVAKVTVFETSEGTASRVVTPWKRVKTERFVVAKTPVAEAERLARKDRKVFLSARIKTGSTLWEGPAEGKRCRTTKVGRHSRVTGGGGQPPKKLPNGTTLRKECEIGENQPNVPQGTGGKWKRIACRPGGIDRRYLSEYKLAACAWPSQAAILQTTSVVYKLEIALLATSVESSAISLLASRERRHPCRRFAGILPAKHARACSLVWYFKQAIPSTKSDEQTSSDVFKYHSLFMGETPWQ
jgi:hypothetical protein